MVRNLTKSSIPSDWAYDLLDRFAKRGSGHTPNKRKPSYWNGGIKWISLSDSSALDQGYIYKTEKEISEEGLKNSSAVLHPAETVVLSRDAGVGKSAVMAEPMAVSQHFIAWRCDNTESLDSWFLYNWLQLMKPEFERQAVGSTIKTIGLPYFKKLKIAVPTISEQKKIAKILSIWDKAIITTEQLLANSQRQKKSLMQQLLTGNKRFSKYNKTSKFKKTRYGLIPEDWSYPAINEVCSQVSERNDSQEEYPVLSCSKYEGFVDSLKYFKKKVYSDDTSAYRIIPRNCFGFPSNHIEEGSIGLQNLCDIGIVSPIYVVFKSDPSKINNLYLYALLKTEHYRQIYSAATNASVDRRGSLRWKEFSSIHIPLPPIEEQNRIASALTLNGREIELLTDRLQLFKREKKALMQQLLTGKIRVKVDKTEAA